MTNDSWMEFREECARFMRTKKENILREWFNVVRHRDKKNLMTNWLTTICHGHNLCVGYYFNLYDHVLELYTDHPGMLIGKAGSNIDLLKKMLSDEFHGTWSVKIIEVRDGFVSV